MSKIKTPVCGIGVYQKGRFKSKEGQRHTREYELWRGMLKRCYSEKALEREPFYRDVSVSENFKYFQYFAEWCNNQIGFGNLDWHLDKDILVKGNKQYSENTCCFIPSEVNLLFTKRDRLRGEYPIGVTFHKGQGKFNARVMKEGVKLNLGSFNCPVEAFYAYKCAKEQHIKDVANRYREVIDERVYFAMINYEINIDD